ncbi:MAG: tetratricopeptide repeat protein [Candidatus Aureabacteria bacterium]|nr:tetratricopeptide repeat protein [Candidatus Auribacterota bacterium]
MGKRQMFYKKSFIIGILLFLVFNLYACSSKKDIAVKEADKIEEALSYYEEKVQENPGMPSSARYRVKLGTIYLRLGEYRKAVSEFITAIATDPSIAEAHYNLGYVYQMMGDDDLAIAEYKNAVSINPEYAEAYNNLGLLMIGKGFAKEGISNLKKSLQNNEKFAPAYYNLGAVHVSKVDDEEKAADYFARYLECVPSGEKSYEAMQYLKNFERATGKMPINTAELHYKRGKIALDREDIDTAILEFGKSIKENPKYFHPYRELGVIFQEHINDKGKALSYYQGYLEKGGLKANDAGEVMGRIKALRKERKQEDIEEEKADKELLEPLAEKTSKNEILPAGVSVSDELKTGEKFFKEREYEKALEKFRIVLGTNPDSLGVLCWTGETYVQLGKISEGKKYFERALSISAKEKRALKGIVNIELISGNEEKAAEMFLSLEEDARAAEIYYLMGSKCFDQYKYQEALNYFDKVRSCDLSRNVSMERASCLRATGRSYLKAGKYKEALSNFEEAIKEDSRYPLKKERTRAALSIAREAVKLKNKDEIDRMVDYVEGLGYDNKDLHNFLGEKYLQEGKNILAIKEFKQVLALSKVSTVSLPASASHDESRGSRRNKDVGQGSQAQKLLAEAYFNVARKDISGKNFSKAEDNLKKSLEFDPNNSGALYALGNLYERHFLDGAGAVKYYKQYIEKYPSGKEVAQAKKYISLYEEIQAVKKDYKTQISKLDKEAVEHYNLAVTYSKQGSIDRAIQEYRKAIVIDFTFAVAHYNLGILYRKKNNNKLAIESYKNAVKTNPGFEKAYTNLGSIYKELGQYDIAAGCFKKAIEINPDNSMSHLGLAHIYDYNKNNLQLAEYHYKKYIKNRPKGKYSDQVKERLNQTGEGNQY